MSIIDFNDLHAYTSVTTIQKQYLPTTALVS